MRPFLSLLAIITASSVASSTRAQVPTASTPPAPPATAGEFPIDRIVAVVGDQPIMWSSVLEQIDVMRSGGRTIPTDSVGLMQLADTVVQLLVNNELLVQKAKAEKIDVSDADLNSSADAQVKRVRSQFKSDAEMTTALQQAGFGSIDEYKKYVMDAQRRDQLMTSLRAKLKQNGKLVASVNDSDVVAYFDAHKAELQKFPAAITFRQVIVSPSATATARALARVRADSLLNEIKHGGDFALIAKRESMDPGSKENGGDLGWRHRGDFMAKQLDSAAFSLEPDQIAIVETPLGFHILRIDRVQAGEVKARHILIRPAVDSADVAVAKRLADSVAGAWRNGASYDTLVRRFHDPIEERGAPNPFPIAQLPESYQKALVGHKAGDVIDPFQIEDKTRNLPKFVVMQVLTMTDEHVATLSEVRDLVREQVQQERAIQRLIAQLRKETYVSIRL
jgi:peptidyl-prolyl cis-trans isomerase SurA